MRTSILFNIDICKRFVFVFLLLLLPSSSIANASSIAMSDIGHQFDNFNQPLISEDSGGIISSEGDEFSKILCKILCYAKNKFVRFVAVIIIIALGVGLFVGKVNWGVALATILALALIFSSEALINSVFDGKDSASLKCDTTC